MERDYDEFDKDGGYDSSYVESDRYAGNSYYLDDYNYDDDREYGNDSRRNYASYDGEYDELCGGARSADASSIDAFDDPIRLYLVQMGDIPMFTLEEERKAATEIDRARRRFRNAALRLDVVARFAVSLLEKIRDGRARLDRTIDVSVSDLAAKKRFLALLEPALATLKRMLKRNREDYRALRCGQKTLAERRAI